MTTLRWGSSTDVGLVRDHNEDQLLVASPLFAVADGMGGHAAGEVAAQVAVESLKAAFDRGPKTADGLADAVEEANRAVWERATSGDNLRGMGTTLTAAALVEDSDGSDRFVVANVGDSRAYLLRDGELTQLTNDHSVAEEMIRSGQLPADQASIHPQRHMLTRAVGIDSSVDIDLFSIDVYRGDRVLLASDGLSNEVTDVQIASTLRRLDDPDEAARDLVAQARAHGGADNITVLIVDVVDDDERAREAALANEPPPAPSRMLSADDRNARLRQLADGEADGDDRSGAAVGEPDVVDPPSRRVTGRVVAFIVAVVLVVAAAAGATAWYARASYYVGIDDGRVTIFKGRPGGVLWFSPTVEERTRITEASLTDRQQRRLDDGHVESSLDDARAYVDRLRDSQERQATTTTTTTAPPPGPAPVPPSPPAP